MAEKLCKHYKYNTIIIELETFNAFLRKYFKEVYNRSKYLGRSTFFFGTDFYTFGTYPASYKGAKSLNLWR